MRPPLRRELQLPVSVGQIMIAPTVEKLATLLSDGQSHQQAGFEAVLPLRKGSGPTLFCFHRRPASRQFSVLQRYLDPRWSLVGIQSPDTQGPLNQSAHLDEVCEAHLRTLRKVQPHGPYYFLGYSLGGTLAQGIAARLEAAGEEVAFLGLLDTGRRKRRTGMKARRECAGSGGAGGGESRARTVYRRAAPSGR